MNSERQRLVAAITDYLCLGGLWNPELANHDAVRDLLIDIREELIKPEKGPAGF